MRHDCWWSHCGRWLINKHQKSTQEPGDAAQLWFSRWDIVTHHFPPPLTHLFHMHMHSSTVTRSCELSLSRGEGDNGRLKGYCGIWKVEPTKLRTSWKWWTGRREGGSRWRSIDLYWGCWLYYLPLMKEMNHNTMAWFPHLAMDVQWYVKVKGHIRFQCKKITNK